MRLRTGLTRWRPALPWPLATIDFEASSQDGDSYPIEVGIAVWSALDAPIWSWSALIRPAGPWARNGHWSHASARVHGISAADLVALGQSPNGVAAALNRALGSGLAAWCDGGSYDQHWRDALFTAAGIAPEFALDDWASPRCPVR